MRWIIGIVVLVVVAILGYQYFGARDTEVAEQAEQSAQQTAGAVGETAEEAAEATEQAATDAGREAEEAAEQVTEEVTDTAEEATQATEETAEQAGEAAQQTAEQATAATEQAASDAAEEVEEATEEVTEEVSTPTGAATEAAEESLSEAQTAALTVGDVNLGEQLGDVVQNTETSLAGITDAASAEAALPALNEINTKLEGLSGTVQQLPEDAKKILADYLDTRVTQLKSTAEGVMNREGVGDVLRPVLEPIMAKLDSWAQQPA